jgi:hypothetical protein
LINFAPKNAVSTFRENKSVKKGGEEIEHEPEEKLVKNKL